jgi:hypothetical protein
MSIESPNIIKTPELIDQQNHEKIKTIESLRTGYLQKADVVLVLLGQKPATDLSVFVDAEELLADEDEKIKSIGLLYKKINQGKVSDRYCNDYLLAKDEATLNELMKYRADKDHEQFGRLMGFPESAVKAYTNKTLLDNNQEQQIYEMHPDIVFNNMRLSKDSYESELEVLRNWSESLKNSAPEIYKQFLEQ